MAIKVDRNSHTQDEWYKSNMAKKPPKMTQKDGQKWPIVSKNTKTHSNFFNFTFFVSVLELGITQEV